jgi:tripartite-type tricarboxylate transporter receptor subunit TctC
MKTKFLALVGLAAGLLGLAAPAQAQTEYYKDKTITLVVGLAPGGTSDVFARSFAVFLKKHIPGNPNIIVQNMPGGAGVLATNYIAERAPKDGTAFLWGPWDPLAQALGDQGLRARYEDMVFLGGIGDTRVNYARTDSVPGGLKKPSDIVKAEVVHLGDSGPTAIAGLLGRLSLDVLGVKNKLISGYRGGADVFLAVQRKELQFGNTSITTFRSRNKDWVQSGEGMGINYFVPVDPNGNYERSKFITEMPAFPDLYKDAYGKMPSGPTWEALNWLTNQIGEMTFVALAPGGIPKEAAQPLQSGFEKAANDPEFIEQTVKANGIPYSFVTQEQGQRIFKGLADVTPEILNTLKATIAKQ